MGEPLSSFEKAARVLTSIRNEIDQRKFDPSNYAKKDLKNFIFENSIEAWFQEKRDEVEKGNRAKGYVRVLRCYINNYYTYFNGYDVREIRSGDIKKFYQSLPKKSLKYIKNIISGLENFFRELVKSELIERAPIFPSITLDERAPKWVDSLTQIQIIKLIPKQDRPIFLFLSWQGVRPGEGRALKVKDIDFQNELITMRRTLSDGEMKERVKSKKEKVRAINPRALGLLKKLCINKHPESFVFINPRTNRHYSESAFRRLWQFVKDKGIDIISYQATRHSIATELSSKGMPLKLLQGFLGHSDIRSTLKYARDDIQSQKLALKQIATVHKLRPQKGPTKEKLR